MKRIYILIVISLAIILPIHAQGEVQGDSIHSHATSGTVPPEGALMPEVKNYNGFLLDMNLLNTEVPGRPRFATDMPTAEKDFSRLFRLNSNVTYSQGLSDIFSPTGSFVYGINPFGLTNFWSSPQTLQMSSFKLKNGMRINTYGEYDMHGRKVPNPSALPWERNNFKGAFEMKSANGSFGIRIEVQRGNERPF